MNTLNDIGKQVEKDNSNIENFDLTDGDSANQYSQQQPNVNTEDVSAEDMNTEDVGAEATNITEDNVGEESMRSNEESEEKEESKEEESEEKEESKEDEEREKDETTEDEPKEDKNLVELGKKISPEFKNILLNKGAEAKILMTYRNILSSVLGNSTDIEKYMYNIHASNYVHNENLSMQDRLENDMVRRYQFVKGILDKYKNDDNFHIPKKYEGKRILTDIIDPNNTMEERIELVNFIKKQPLSFEDIDYYTDLNLHLLNKIASIGAFTQIKNILENTLTKYLGYTEKDLTSIPDMDMPYEMTRTNT